MGNSLRSDNPIAKLNACTLISTFSKPYSEVASATHTPRRKAVEEALRCFLDLLKTAGVFPTYAGFQEKMRRERNGRKRAVPEPEGERELHLFRNRYSSWCLPLRSPSSSFEILHLSAGRRFLIGCAQKTAPISSTFRGEGRGGAGDLE